MAHHPIFNRNYICRRCGKIRRASAHYVPNGPPAPLCCETEMRTLSYEATVVVNRMSEADRLKWIRSGAKYVKAAGRRRWKPARGADA